jgi:hypothetical protein
MGELRCGVIMIEKQRSGCPRCRSSGSGAQSRNARDVSNERRYTGSSGLTLKTRTSDAMINAPATNPVTYG